MKKNIIASSVVFSVFSILMYGQVTEGEKNLRTLSADTTLGWKKRGVFSYNF